MIGDPKGYLVSGYKIDDDGELVIVGCHYVNLWERDDERAKSIALQMFPELIGTILTVIPEHDE